jgi:hypothetical protein
MQGAETACLVPASTSGARQSARGCTRCKHRNTLVRQAAPGVHATHAAQRYQRAVLIVPSATSKYIWCHRRSWGCNELLECYNLEQM